MVVQIIRLLFSSIWRVPIGVGWVEKGVFCIQAPLSIKWLTDMNTTNIKKETLCKHKLHKPNIYMLRKMFYSSSKRSDSCIWVFLQLMPWHSLQIMVHLSPCLTHIHLEFLQPPLQLHRNIFKSSGGAGGISIKTGISLLFWYM